MTDPLNQPTDPANRDAENEKIPSVSSLASADRQAGMSPEMAPPDTLSADKRGGVPELDVDPEGRPSDSEGYAPSANPDSPELTDTPGITEVSPDATSQEIEAHGSLPDGPQRVNQQIV